MFTDEFIVWINKQSITLRHFFPHASTEEEKLARMTKLSEEVGELASEVLGLIGQQRKEKVKHQNKETLGAEVADVIITTMLLADAFAIDVPAALTHKIKKIDERFSEMEKRD